MIRRLCPSRWLLSSLVVLCSVDSARALDPNRMTQQYFRERWSLESGLLNGEVRAIAQTPDGYLWIGTDQGLVRFDGFTFSAVPLSAQALLSSSPVLGLLADADGNLWIRLQGASLLRHGDGKIGSVESGLGRSMAQVTAILRETDGGVLVSDLMAGVLRFRGEKSEVLANPTTVPGSSPVISMVEMSDGRIWIGTLGAGLFYLAEGRAVNVASRLVDREINCLLAVSEQELWVGTDRGLFRWTGTALRSVELPPSLSGAQILAMLRDRDLNIWVGTTKGLLRINATGASLSEEKDLRGNGGINALFEDREGNIWVGGARGLERIRDTAFMTYRHPAGLGSENSGPVYVDAENRVWFAPPGGGLYALTNTQLRRFASREIGKDVVYSVTGGKGGIWVGRQRGGLTHLQYRHGIARVRSYTEANGLAQNSVYAVYQSRDGAVWAGTLSGGVTWFKDGRFGTYTTANGLVSNTINAISETRDGTIWFGTPNGLSSLSNGQWRTYSAPDGLPSESVNCLFEDLSGALWTGTSDGLALFRSGRFQVPDNLPDVLRGQVYGMAEDKNGWFWVGTAEHVLRVRRDKLAAGKLAPGDLREYGLEDGLLSVEAIKRTKSVVSDASGRIWFSLRRGLAVVDPSHLTDNSAPAIAHVEAISADGSPVETGGAARLPASPKRITFAYTGLSLAAPERVRFRYLLEGFDRAWSEPVASREAVYTNLSPGPYRFRLVACNSDGLWNGAETALPIEIEPLLWQTSWFRLSSVLLIGLAILMWLRLRMRRMARQLNIRFEERLAERTRIAQELHDTMLQGFLSASMQLHVADDRIPSDSPAKAMVGRVLELMGQVIEEGRNAVRGLRLSKAGLQDLKQAFSRIRPESRGRSQVGFRVVVEGTPQPLRPIIYEEVYRIGREALSNALRRPEAKDVEVKVEYAESGLRVLIRDDGAGIDPQALDAGRDERWGLSEMKKRTKRIGGKLQIVSHGEAGTEVELSVPGRIAFEPSSGSEKGQ